MFKYLFSHLKNSPEANVCRPMTLALWKVRLRRTFLAHANIEAMETWPLWKVRGRRTRGEVARELWTKCKDFLFWKVRLARTRSRVRRTSAFQLTFKDFYKRQLIALLQGWKILQRDTIVKRIFSTICEWWMLLKIFPQDSSPWLARFLRLGFDM
jgi:hypothetical protein